MDKRLAKSKSETASCSRRAVIQEKVLSRGESKYQERVEDIRVLKLEVKRLKQEETLLIKSTQSMEEMKKVCYDNCDNLVIKCVKFLEMSGNG